MRGEWALRTHAPHHLLMESWEYMHLSILILNYSIDRLCRSVCVCSVLVCWCLFIHCWSLIWWYHIINTRKTNIKRRRKKTFAMECNNVVCTLHHSIEWIETIRKMAWQLSSKSFRSSDDAIYSTMIVVARTHRTHSQTHINDSHWRGMSACNMTNKMR